MINGSFWVGAALGALVAVALLNPALIYPEFGWRLAFLTGAGLGVVVFLMRMWIPESPRWLAIHGREVEGEAVVAGIERRFVPRARVSSRSPPAPPSAYARATILRLRKCSTRSSGAIP
jgi:MFS family permease